MIQHLEIRQVLAMSAALRLLAPADRLIPLSASVRLALAEAYEEAEKVRLRTERKKRALIGEVSGGKASIDPATHPDLYQVFSERWDVVLSETHMFECGTIPRSEFSQFVIPIPHLAALLPLAQ